MVAAAILNFSGLDKDIYTTFYGKMHHGHAVTRSPDQNLKREVNSRDIIK